MKTVAIVPTYRRPEITTAVVRNLFEQTVPIDIVVVGSERQDREAAMEAGALYVEHDNAPLSYKIQAGVNMARELNPDAIMTCGSDDWLSANWIETLGPYLENYEIVGSGAAYLLRILSVDIVQLVRLTAYTGTSRYGEPIGTGRLISKRTLDGLDWQLYRESKDSGCDRMSFRIMKKNGARSFLYTEDKTKVLCPKGMWWPQLDPWDVFMKSQGIEWVSNAPEWMEANFPGLLEFLRKRRMN